MAITKIHAVKVRLGDAINYIENPNKTDGQELISGYNTAPQTAVLDFSITAAMARKARNTSAKKQGNLAYHLIQSFSPDDAVTPELAHKLGRKLAMEFTDGKFEFVVATHINKDSIHNHIIINAVSFYDYKKLRTVPYRTAQQIRSISDRLCMESQLSVIKDPQQLLAIPSILLRAFTINARKEFLTMAMNKLERIEKDIEKTKGKIAELQKQLRELEAAKTEQENLQIVQLVRGLNMTPQEFAAFVRGGALQAAPAPIPDFEQEDNAHEEI